MKKAAVREDGDAPVATITTNKRKILTGAIKMVHDGVQKGVLGGEEALHHWHLGLSGGKAALLLTGLHSSLSFLREPGREATVPPKMFQQCSDAGRVSPSVKPPQKKLTPGHFQAA